MPNPFDIVSAELMDLTKVGQEFVSNHTEFAKLASYTHTVVWGSRGSGKSIHFRFLEPLAQASRRDYHFNGDVKSFLNSPASFVGVYINCREGVLNKEEFRLVDSLPDSQRDRIQILIDCHLAAEVVRSIHKTFREQLPWLLNLDVQPTLLPTSIQNRVPRASTQLGQVLQAIDTWGASIRHAVSTAIDHIFLGLPLDASGLADGLLRTTPTIRELCEWLQLSCGLDCPFFLLFDEANELSRPQQASVNALIGIRSQKSLCIKVASQLHGFTPHMANDDTVDETHDYTTLDLESLYTNHQEAYYERVKTIANERLHRAGIATNIYEYLIENPNDTKLHDEARQLAAKRYDQLPPDARPIDKMNFIKKYAPAIVFQELRPTKASRSYAGFDNVVHFSSGIVRAFLDCCSRMYSRCLESVPGSDPTQIPIRIQNDVMIDYSDDFIKSQLLDKIDGFPIGSEQREIYQHLHNLLNSLGALYRERLLDKSSREPRIISVSLKEKPTERLEKVLKLAEREAFLHRKWYRSKRGNRNLPCYVLNRRLCPHFNLDLSGFQGRIELLPEQLEVALEGPKPFLALVKKARPSEEQQPGLFELSEW